MNSVKRNRLGVFVFYDPEGIVDRYVLFFLKQVQPLLNRLVIVCNGTVNQKGLVAMSSYTNDIFVRDNKGFDAMAVKQALMQYVGWENLEVYDDVVIMNDTFFGPFFSLQPIFNEMDTRDKDLWGLLLRIKGETESANATLFGAFFYVMGHRLIQNKSWKLFWENMDGEEWSFSEAIEKYEYQLIPECEKAGCEWDAYWRSDRYTGLYPESSFDDYGNIAYELIKYHGYPFLKKKPFSQENSFIYSNSSTLRQAVSYIDKHLDYDIDMIWENILRKYDIGSIKNALQLTHIFHESNKNIDHCKFNQIAIILILKQKDWVGDYLSFISSLDKKISIFIFCEDYDIYQTINSKWKKNEKKCFAQRLSDTKKILRNVKKICDSKKLLLYIDDSFLVYDKRPIVVGRTIQSVIHKCLWESDLIISAIIDEFQNNQHLGVGILPCFYHNIYIQDFQNTWSGFYDKVQNLLGNKTFIVNEESCINNKPVFWVRSNILSIAIDFLIEMDESWESIYNILGRIIPYIAQREGYYTEEFLNTEIAEINLSNMESLIKQLLDKNNIKMEEYRDIRYVGLLEFCNKFKNVYIYGAGVWGKRVLQKLKINGVSGLGGFIVSERRKDIEYIEEYKVYEFADIKASDDEGIIIAVRENQQPMIEKELRKNNFKNIFLI